MEQWPIQLITLLGVTIGALASFVTTRLVDRSRWQREEALRWGTKRLESYGVAADLQRRSSKDEFVAGEFELAPLVASDPVREQAHLDVMDHDVTFDFVTAAIREVGRERGGARPADTGHAAVCT
jgi:hypothetical protein